MPGDGSAILREPTILIGPVPDGSGFELVGVLAVLVVLAALALLVVPAAIDLAVTVRRALVQTRSADGDTPGATGDADTDRWSATAQVIVAGAIVAVGIGLLAVFGLVIAVGIVPLLGFLWLPVVGVLVALAVVALARRRGWWTYD